MNRKIVKEQALQVRHGIRRAHHRLRLERSRTDAPEHLLALAGLANVFKKLVADLGLPGSVACVQMLHHENHAYFAYGSSPFAAAPHADRRRQACTRKRSALLMTDTDDRLIAKAAISGLSNQPVTGYRIPAAIGMPSAL